MCRILGVFQLVFYNKNSSQSRGTVECTVAELVCLQTLGLKQVSCHKIIYTLVQIVLYCTVFPKINIIKGGKKKSCTVVALKSQNQKMPGVVVVVWWWCGGGGVVFLPIIMPP